MPRRHSPKTVPADEQGALVEVEQPAGVPAPPQPAPQDATGMVAVIERIAMSPEVDVAKIEKLWELQERILDRNAEIEFNAAFSRLQEALPTVIESASGDSRKWQYAPLEDIVEQTRPVLVKHGFSISHRTEWPGEGVIRVIGVLSHKGGHSRESVFLSPADPSGSKNKIQGVASTVSYGRRYTVKDLLCIVTRGEDDDGHQAGKKETRAPEAPTVPTGYDNWVADLEIVASEGLKRFGEVWNRSNPEYRTYLVRHQKAIGNRIRAKAEQAVEGAQ